MREMPEELKKKLDEAAYMYEGPSHRNCYGCCQSDSDYAKAYNSAGNWMWNQLADCVEALETIANNATFVDEDCNTCDYQPNFRSYHDDNCASQLAIKVLSKLKESR